MKFRRSLLGILVALASVQAEEHPVKALVVSMPGELEIGIGQSQDFKLGITVPRGYHAYLRHANLRGRAIPISFRVPGDSGFQVETAKAPKGVRLGDEIILRGTGEFTIRLSELAMHGLDETNVVPVAVRVQLCSEGEEAICFLPETIEKKITIRIGSPEIRTRALPDTSLPWIDNRAAALEAAKLKNQNILALISDPARCGACAQLETKVLPDAAVQKLLREQFVLYRVPRSEYRHAPISGSFGIPFYFVISASGENKQKWMGAPAPSAFVRRLEPYANAGATEAPGSIHLASGSGKCAIPLKQSFAFQAVQKGEFQNAGNMRFVANASQPGSFTVLTLDRTGEIDTSNSAKVVDGRLVVERYLGTGDLVFQCSPHGITGNVSAQQLQLSIELR